MRLTHRFPLNGFAMDGKPRLARDAGAIALASFSTSWTDASFAGVIHVDQN
jgi:hypothetical protein